MATIPRPSVIHVAEERPPIPLPERVTIGLAAFQETVREGLLAFCVGVGLSVVAEIFEEEIAQLVGPRGKHDRERTSYRHGQEDRQLTLGARRVEVQKPRARTKAGGEVELESFRFFASRDLLTQAALDRMLARLSTRRYGAGLEPVGVKPKAITRSSISRRFVTGSTRKLRELMGRPVSAPTSPPNEPLARSECDRPDRRWQRSPTVARHLNRVRGSIEDPIRKAMVTVGHALAANVRPSGSQNRAVASS